MNKTITPFTLLTPQAFVEEVLKDSEKAKKRLWIEAMYAYPGKVFDALFSVLINAQKRNVDIRLTFDYLMLLSRAGKKFKTNNTIVKKVANHHIPLKLTNPPTWYEKLWYFIGRNHIKMVLVDDIAYVGGVNIGDEDITLADFMVKITDKGVVSHLDHIFTTIYRDTLHRDEYIGIDSNTNILLDSGKPFTSVIFKNALHLIRNAEKSIYFTSQLVPEGKMLTALYEAKKRGVEVKVIVPVKNTFSTFFTFLNKTNLYSMSLWRKPIPVFTYPTMVHAKLLVIDEHVMCFGSHNLSSYGVWAGTEEITIETKNTFLIQQGITFFNELLKKSSKVT